MVGLINKEDIYDIADAIREKTQTERTFTPSQMGGLIRSIKVVPENSYQLKEIESTPTSLATFDADALPMPKLKVSVDAVQDLHGYDAPWVGGAGKNKLPLILSDIKALNYNGVWSGNSYTYQGLTFTVKTTENDNIIGIQVNGTATGNARFNVYSSSTGNPFGGMWFSCVPSGDASNSTYRACLQDATGEYVERARDFGDGAVVAASDVDIQVWFTVYNGYACNNMMFLPQIEEGTTKTTFAPYSNICPINGWDEVDVTRCGKNLINALGTDTNNGYVTGQFITYYGYLSGANTFAGFVTEYNPIKGGETYLINGIAGGSPAICFYTKNKTFISGIKYNNRTSFTFTAPSNAYYIRASVANVNKETAMLVVGSTATSYEPYNGHTYTIQFRDGDNPLTVYGGTLDVVSGELTVDRASVDLGTLEYVYDSTVPRFYSFDINSLVKAPLGNVVVNAISSDYIATSFDNLYVTDKRNGTFAVGTTGTLSIINTLYTDPTAFKTAMSGVQLVYELATPQTIQLTPTQVNSLLGTNNLWADTGNILEGEYFKAL